jgi:hypothetical protein
MLAESGRSQPDIQRECSHVRPGEREGLMMRWGSLDLGLISRLGAKLRGYVSPALEAGMVHSDQADRCAVGPFHIVLQAKVSDDAGTADTELSIAGGSGVTRMRIIWQ